MNQANLRCLGHSVSVGAKERTTMTLKEKIVAKVAGCGMNCDPSEIAESILEIPELKEALAYMAAVDSAHPVFGEIREMLDRERQA
jgi:hypothetical protein